MPMSDTDITYNLDKPNGTNRSDGTNRLNRACKSYTGHRLGSVIMIFFFNLSACIASALLAGAVLVSCNSENYLEASGLKPQIILDSEYGVYEVKVGRELTIAPEYKNLDDGTVTWTLDGEIVNEGESWTSLWPEQGEYYVTITAANAVGRSSEEVRVDVLDLTPPVISLNVPVNGFVTRPGEYLMLMPTYRFDDVDGFSVTWRVDGEEVAKGRSYAFMRDQTGTYTVAVEAANVDGESVAEFEVTVSVDGGRRVWFPTSYYGATSTDRYTFAGRPVFLRPEFEGISVSDYRWTIDGEAVDCTDRVLKFIPDEPGEYTVTVTVGDDATATVTVVCVEGDEMQRMRKATAASKATFDKVYEWLPAPGQFINETSAIGGMSGVEPTMEAACEWAAKRMQAGLFVSLGAYGGYIIAGFDHSVAARQEAFDFAVGGNAYLSDNGGSNEAGIVWVMQDVNGNGLPDDEWYELKGSEYDSGESRQYYSVTYFRPPAPAMDVNWVDSDGKSGAVRYMAGFHDQDYYYPAWIGEAAYTLTGSLLPSRNSIDPLTGRWINRAYAWGYADNIGSDNLPGAMAGGEGQRNGFRIANAVCPDGTPANLQYIDFVKVQTAVFAQSGILGEVSTEVCGFSDCAME